MIQALPAIVLAAGASRRLGQPKQLVMHKGETLLARAVRLAREAGLEPVFYVLGANRVRICMSMTGSFGIEVNNEQWEQGISTSIHAGLRAVDEHVPGASGVLILPCDQPKLDAAHLRELLRIFLRHPAPVIAASTYANIFGVPAIFPRQTFSSLYALQGDKGARALLANPPCALVAVPFDGGETDIDEPADLAVLE